MTRPTRSISATTGTLAILLGLSLAACELAASSGTSLSLPPDAASASAKASVQASAGASASNGQQAFTCSFPIRVAATTNRAQITDLQVGAHDGFDQIVYTFAAGLPRVTVEAATPPLTQDASGQAMRVDGSSFVRLVLHGGTVQLPAGGVSYNGAVSMTPQFAKLVDLQSAGDFEAVSSWYLGLAGQACVRVSTLEGPSRLVIDIQH